MAATTLADRALLRVSGDDPQGFLQGLVTNDLRALAPGKPLWAGLLTAQGKALFDFVLWDAGEAVLIDCEEKQAEALARRLALYRLRRAIDIEPEDGLAVHWHPRAPATAGTRAEGETGFPLPHERSADPRLADLGQRWLAPAGEGDASAEWREHRLRLGVTEGVAELGADKTLWLECNARELAGVAFDKGCFVGQENTARMNWRGKVNRRLVVVPADAPGARTRIHYAELGLAVEHRRIDYLGDAIVPDWLAAALGR